MCLAAITHITFFTHCLITTCGYTLGSSSGPNIFQPIHPCVRQKGGWLRQRGLKELWCGIAYPSLAQISICLTNTNKRASCINHILLLVLSQVDYHLSLGSSGPDSSHVCLLRAEVSLKHVAAALARDPKQNDPSPLFPAHAILKS